jgi:hypothetical protein
LAQEKATVDGIESASSTEKTSIDIPLVFELQRVSTSGGYGGFQVWGKVTNPGDDTYEGIGLIITVYSSKGKLLGRGRTSDRPGVIGKGQVGYVDQFSIEIEKRKPARITWKVVSEGF